MKKRQPARARRLLVGGAVAFWLGFAAPAQSQTIRNTGTDNTQVDLGFVGNVRNSIILTIIGTGATTITNEVTSGMPTHASATIEFGTFATQLQPPPSNGTGYRVSLPSPGAVVAATLDAMVTYNGATTASLTVSRLVAAGGPPDVPLADLRVASPALATWTSGTEGAQVPDAGLPGYDLCTASGDPTCETGKPYNHSLAVFLPDNRAAGPFTTVVVYTGTMP
ncbi:MAG: hypothetical protein JXP73_19100 [Deltaproteobacteria bacterium]|nr:hypothetical protein [Deltaproteobacteria bacterium]